MAFPMKTPSGRTEIERRSVRHDGAYDIFSLTLVNLGTFSVRHCPEAILRSVYDAPIEWCTSEIR